MRERGFTSPYKTPSASENHPKERINPMGKRENIRRAKEIISNRRAAAAADYEKHIAEASAKIPGFAEIDAQLAATGPKIMAAAIGHSDVPLEAIRAEYEGLANRRKVFLRMYNFPADYCDIHYTCEKCSDTGYVGINICECLKKEIVRENLENSGLYSLAEKQNFNTFTLDYYEKDDKIIMAQNVRLLREFAENFVPGKSGSFLFLGATGLGKTHLSTAAAQEIIKTGAYVVYESALTMFEEFQEQRFHRSSYEMDENSDGTDRFTECDLLIIDDLGCEVSSQFTVSCLYQIINTRMLHHKSTIISTNLNQEELRKRYSDRITSRLFGEYKPLVFRGNDVRKLKTTGGYR